MSDIYVESSSMKSLDSLLHSLHLQSFLHNRVVLGEPWGVRFPDATKTATFHFVEVGGGYLSVPGEKAVHLDQGDLAIVFASGSHSVQDNSMSPAIDVNTLVEQADVICKSGITLQFGGDGPQTSVISGVFYFEEGDTHPLYRALPPYILLKGEGGQAAEWLDATLRLLSAEAMEARPGVRAVLDRLCDVLFIQSLRGWVRADGSSVGLPMAVKDPAIDEALDMMQRRPNEPWTVERLAHAVALSRSVFAERFRRLLGDTPMDYLQRWRMHLAAQMLREGRETTANIAEKVGYESEASFAKAFKKLIGVAPGAFRKASSSALL
jgi:AraC-like DNA-binding protein